jgi:hypothetical protein
MFLVTDHPIHQVSLKHTDRDRFPLLSADASPLTLKFMGADPGTHCRQRRCFTVLPVRFLDLPFPNQLDESGNIVMDRASFLTLGFFALEAALRLLPGSFIIKTTNDFVEISDPTFYPEFFWVLAGKSHSRLGVHNYLLNQ